MKRISDYFTGPELVELLEVSAEELVYLLEDQILEKREQLDEYIG